MSNPTEALVLSRLTSMRADLIHHLTEELTEKLPIISPRAHRDDSPEMHRERMHKTATRFHDTLMAAADAGWSLISFDYSWASRVLQPLGVTWEHQDTAITAYFAIARRLAEWSDEEDAALTSIEQHMRAEVQPAYTA
ncbi:hypothetical protein [Candidatus Viridilinea mediisalina]|uniref:Uncharacterized protein n=1 Tax=Candidatus Viridilinea mediisalina TaxID=2024553 RepID=A0A2A6RGD9_9CHLR|nr:hypothetical protein [Candidatus Viridilinea mediisalina]PDW02001.1 hypothetical protein CJ255_16155 [Candidatus Viridilinea mediisalina]